MHDEEPWRPLTVEEARALGWRPRPDGCGTVTQACDEWLLTSRDQRTYLRLTLPWMAERFDAEWAAMMQVPAHEDSPEPIDVYESRVGIMPGDWLWMTLAAVVRDAVTAYEVYVVKAYEEVARTHWLPVSRDKAPPPFQKVQQRCRVLDLDVRPPEVDRIFRLRNVLTHQGGQLRTEQERQQFSEDGGLWGVV